MPLKGQELHFADQIDGLLKRIGRIERFLGGRWHIAEAVKAIEASEPQIDMSQDARHIEGTRQALARAARIKSCPSCGQEPYDGHDMCSGEWFGNR